VSWTGRTDTNKRVVFPSCGLSSPVLSGLSREEAQRFATLRIGRGREEVVGKEVMEGGRREEEAGDRIEASFSDSSSAFITSSSSSSSSSSSNSVSGGEKGVYKQGQGRAHVDVTADLEEVAGLVRDLQKERKEAQGENAEGGEKVEGGAVIEKGSYVVVKILSARGHTLRYARIQIRTYTHKDHAHTYMYTHTVTHTHT
jgi:hypothetical protein